MTDNLPPAPPPPPPPPPGTPAVPPAGGAPAPSGGADVGKAVSWAISKLGQNLGVLVAFAALIMAIGLLNNWLTDALQPDTESASGLKLAGLSLTQLAVSVGAWILITLAEIGLINSALKITKGEKAQFSDLWTPKHFWQFVLVGIIFGLLAGIGLVLCVIPGLLAIWAWQFSRYAALDTGPGVFASFGESWRLVKANKGPAVLTLLISFLANIITVITCGIGALVVAPFVILFMANMYRQFKGEEIAA